MAYSDSFPATRPVFQADFANGGRVDPRISYSRSTTGSFYGKDKHLSSENLFAYSSPPTGWTLDSFTLTSGQTAPDGSTNAVKLTEDTSGSEHRIYPYSSISTDGGATTLSGHFKYIGRQWVMFRLNDGTTYRRVWFDIQNGALGSAETGITHSITASGNGYYKCVATIATSNTSYLPTIGGAPANTGITYTGSGADAFYVWGLQYNNNVGSVLSETSGQIHREYAPTLQTAASGAARFEHSTDGQSAGTSLGILVEQQSSNLVTYSEDFTNWATTRSQVESSVAVGPDGTLSADRLVEDTSELGSNSHYIQSSITTTNSTQYTMSVYAKHGGGANRYCQLRVMGVGNGFAYANFDVSNGTHVGSSGSILDGYSISSVGNGWHRLTLTFTNQSSGGTVTGMGVVIAASNSELPHHLSDDYSGILLFGAQCELGGHCSSLVSTSGASATRAADSLSMVDANLFDNGDGTIVAEYDTNNPSAVAGIAAITDGTGSSNAVSLRLQASTAKLFVNDAGSTQAATSTTAPSAGVFQKIAGRYAVNDFGVSVNGGTVVTDANGSVPVISKLEIGTMDNGSYHLNGHVKRVAIYNEALSDTNLQALTS